MDQPFTGERFWADDAARACAGPDGKARALKTRACARLAEAVLTTTHPDLFATPARPPPSSRVKARARMTRFGGDCYGYCLLAAGCIDLIVEAGLKPYDVVALVPIIEAPAGDHHLGGRAGRSTAAASSPPATRASTRRRLRSCAGLSGRIVPPGYQNIARRQRLLLSAIKADTRNFTIEPSMPQLAR